MSPRIQAEYPPYLYPDKRSRGQEDDRKAAGFAERIRKRVADKAVATSMDTLPIINFTLDFYTVVTVWECGNSDGG
jgi:hypothetical protein